jgi:hypothetical protein
VIDDVFGGIDQFPQWIVVKFCVRTICDQLFHPIIVFSFIQNNNGVTFIGLHVETIFVVQTSDDSIFLCIPSLL